MKLDLTQLSNQIRRERANAVDRDVEVFATERIQDYRTRKRRLMREDAFEQFVLDYISEQRELAEQDEREDLCECGSLCAIKRGEVPPAILLEDNFADGVTRLKRQHNGHPTVIVEAADEFASYYAATLAIGEEALVSLRRNEIVHLDENPAPDPAPDAGAEVSADD